LQGLPVGTAIAGSAEDDRKQDSDIPEPPPPYGQYPTDLVENKRLARRGKELLPDG
jgi:hypothetical protein